MAVWIIDKLRTNKFGFFYNVGIFISYHFSSYLNNKFKSKFT